VAGEASEEERERVDQCLRGSSRVRECVHVLREIMEDNRSGGVRTVTSFARAKKGRRTGLIHSLTLGRPSRADLSAARAGPPLFIAIPGLLCGLVAVFLAIVSLIRTVPVGPGAMQYGWVCLFLISVFGIYGSVEFFLGKSVRPLMLALALGVFMDVTAL